MMALRRQVIALEIIYTSSGLDPWNRPPSEWDWNSELGMVDTDGENVTVIAAGEDEPMPEPTT